MKYKVWICVESCDEEYDVYEDVDVPFAEVATLDTESEALEFASALQTYGAAHLLNRN
jgi:hypothetical protein